VDQSAAKACSETAHYMTNVSTALIFNPFRDDGEEKTYAGKRPHPRAVVHSEPVNEMEGTDPNPTLPFLPTLVEAGNPEMESEANEQRRESLRDHPAVQDAISRVS